ncbi:IS66 family insertion sequence element accessory protein TnpA [Chitinophaga sancti]|uniref:IS66 family insertion sequence element accessory protein TnpA n=1 Tax=Chitinophaga sancti TaxID=1004 RepID=UPI001160465E
MFSLISEQVNTGRSVKSICDQHNIQSSNWFYWQKKYHQRQISSNGDESSFTLLQITPDLITPNDPGIFAEYKGIKLYQQVSASFLRELIR